MEPADTKSSSTPQQQERARETMDILFELNQLLRCGLDRETLSISVSLLEQGVNPEALAAVVKELRRESHAAVQNHPQTTSTTFHR